MRFSTSQCQKLIHISYRLPDIEDSYADFRRHDGGTSIERIILAKPLKGGLRNMSRRKQRLRYFPLADSVAPFSAVLELFASIASESPIFGFCIF